jgi:hypothetical protein
LVRSSQLLAGLFIAACLLLAFAFAVLTQLKNRLDELEQERGCLRESIRRIGETLPPTSIARPCWNWR